MGAVRKLPAKKFGSKPISLPALFSFMLLIILLFSSFRLVPARALEAEELRVHFIDVGQGDAILIKALAAEADERRKLLIDSGPNHAGSTVVDYLEELGVNTIHLAIATHPHADHIGGFTDVLASFEMEKIIDSMVEHDTITYREYKEALDENEVEVIGARAGSAKKLAEGVEIKILNPEAPGGSDPHRENVVARLSFGDTAFMFTGDAEIEVEEKIVARFEELESGLLKVGHHGSSTSTGPEFLEAVNPAASVIQAGYDNRYGHPHEEVLYRLEEHGVDIYRTDLQGDLVFISCGQELAPAQDPVDRDEDRTSDPEEPPKINVNTASYDELQEITGIGPATAENLISYREEHGPFTDPEELKNVSGIGPARLEDMLDEIEL